MIKLKKPVCGRCGWQKSGICRRQGSAREDQFVGRIDAACEKFTEAKK